MSLIRRCANTAARKLLVLSLFALGTTLLGGSLPRVSAQVVSPPPATTAPDPTLDAARLPPAGMLYQEACLPPDGSDAAEHLRPFRQRIDSYPDRELISPLPGEPASLPPGYRPWWDTRISDSTRPSGSQLSVNVDSLVLGALTHSPHVLAVATETDIRQTAVQEELGVFDWRAFVRQNYDDLSDPVGNLLTTGGPPRYRDNHWQGDYGVRRRTGTGGELELSQRLGFQNTNSKFFVPNNQGSARLEISYTQPLLNRFGRAYNESRVVVAQIDASVARDDFKGSVQEHLYRVAQAYWELYRARALYLQKQNLLASALSILEALHARERVDAVHRQVLRARAAVASRRSEITQAEMSIRNSESQLRLLVNDPCLLNTTQIELVPLDLPPADYLPVSLRQSLHTALVNRPDVVAGIRDIRAAGVRLGIAENELLPKLDLILNVYSAGLEGNQEIYQAFANQFGVFEPGYTIGVLLEVPLGNNTARAVQQRRALELRRALLEFQAIVETGLTEVELAVRTLETSYQVLISKYQSMLAASEEATYLERRWRLLPQDATTTAQLLEELLDAQERVADQEADYVTAQIAYAPSTAQWKRSMGVLLRLRPNTDVDVPAEEVPAEEVPPGPPVPEGNAAVVRLPSVVGSVGSAGSVRSVGSSPTTPE